MTYQTTTDRYLASLDERDARRTAADRAARRKATAAAIGRARMGGTCAPCVWGSLDESGNVGECYCAPCGEHGPAFTPAVEVLAFPTGYSTQRTYRHSAWGSMTPDGYAIYLHGRAIGTADSLADARTIARNHNNHAR